MISAPATTWSTGDLDLGIIGRGLRPGRTSISEGVVRTVSEPATATVDFDSLRTQAAVSWASMVIDPLLSLPANWDSYGSAPLDGTVAKFGKGLLAGLAVQGVASPQAFPTADGGLSLEWHRPELDFVISISPPGEEPSTAYFRSSTDEWEIDNIHDPRIGAVLAALKEG